MSDLSEAAKVRAYELMHAERSPLSPGAHCCADAALARFIQDVSNAAKEIDRWFELNGQKVGYHMVDTPRRLAKAFILPEPDPLVDAIAAIKMGKARTDAQIAADLCAALEERGLQIVEVGK